jgi:hypothetical protein
VRPTTAEYFSQHTVYVPRPQIKSVGIHEHGVVTRGTSGIQTPLQQASYTGKKEQARLVEDVWSPQTAERNGQMWGLIQTSKVRRRHVPTAYHSSFGSSLV